MQHFKYGGLVVLVVFKALKVSASRQGRRYGLFRYVLGIMATQYPLLQDPSKIKHAKDSKLEGYNSIMAPFLV